MIINKQPVGGTRRLRCTFDSGTVLESQIIYLSTAQWDSLKLLTTLHKARTSEVIGRLIDNEIETLRSV